MGGLHWTLLYSAPLCSFSHQFWYNGVKQKEEIKFLLEDPTLVQCNETLFYAVLVAAVEQKHKKGLIVAISVLNILQVKNLV